MKITSIKLEQDIDDKLRTDITKYHERFAIKPTTIIISKPLADWLKHTLMEKAKYANTAAWKEELNCRLMTFEGLNIIETLKENVIEIF